MSIGTKVELHIAATVAERLAADLAPFCERIAVAGSIRRKASQVSDIELVAIPRQDHVKVDMFKEEEQRSLLDMRLKALLEERQIVNQPPQPEMRPAWGEKYKKFWLKINSQRGMIQVDLFITTADSWGSIFTIRTGPAEFGKALMTHINSRREFQQRDGALYRLSNGALVPTPEEKDYFAAIGLLYIPPEQRTLEALKRAAARWVKGGDPKRRMAEQEADREVAREVVLPVETAQAEESGGEQVRDTPAPVCAILLDDIDVRALIRARLEAAIDESV